MYATQDGHSRLSNGWSEYCPSHGSYLPELEGVEQVHLVAAEAGVAEMIACTRHTVVALVSDWAHVAVAAGYPQVQGGPLGTQTPGGGRVVLLEQLLR